MRKLKNVRPGEILLEESLTPVRIRRADAVRAKLAELDIAEQDIADAVAWSRKPKRGAK
jgi:plasmid maintenance system antidote protein VapI